MSNAKRDENGVTAIQGVSSIDGLTTTDVFVDPDTNRLLVDTDSQNPTAGANPSIILGYTGEKLTTIDKTIGAKTYRQTLGYTEDQLTSVSEWVEV